MVSKRPKRTYCVYVIELDKAVTKTKWFKDANPEYTGEKACVYVGYTSKTPEQRFEEHISGARNKRGPIHSKKVKKYGVRLRPRLYKSLQNMTEEDAKFMEVEKARRLRKRGYGVWQK